MLKKTQNEDRYSRFLLKPCANFAYTTYNGCTDAQTHVSSVYSASKLKNSDFGRFKFFTPIPKHLDKYKVDNVSKIRQC